MKQIKVVIDMTADLFHLGHVNLLRNTKKLFEGKEIRLTVALHTDEQIVSFKKREPVMNYFCRKEVVEACKYVDEVIEAPDAFDQEFIDSFDYLVHGDDVLAWDLDLFNKYYKLFQEQQKLILLPYTKGISTTKLREYAVALTNAK